MKLQFYFLFFRKLKEDKEEIEEQRRLRQEEEERSLVTVSLSLQLLQLVCGKLSGCAIFQKSSHSTAKIEILTQKQLAGV